MKETRGERLRRLRLRAGYRRQSQLAAVVGVSASIISFWENDLRVPTVSNAQALAEALGVPLAALDPGPRPIRTKPNNLRTTNQDMAKFRAMALAGKTATEIDLTIGKWHGFARYWSKELGIPLHNGRHKRLVRNPGAQRVICADVSSLDSAGASASATFSDGAFIKKNTGTVAT